MFCLPLTLPSTGMTISAILYKKQLAKDNYLDFARSGKSWVVNTPIRSNAHPENGSFAVLDNSGEAIQFGQKFPHAPVFDMGGSVFSRKDNCLYFKGVWGDEVYRIQDGKPETFLKISGVFNDVDVNGSFMHSNPSIPSESRYHCFLIDENGHPFFVGNPLAGDRIRSVFFSVLNDNPKRL